MTSELLDLIKYKSGNWITSAGWCVDANGAEDGRGVNMMHYSEDDCFKLCEKNSDLNGCTFMVSHGICTTYSGVTVGGNGNGDYKCRHRSGNGL